MASIPNEQNIAWCWAIIFAFLIPEVGTWLRSLRFCIFKRVKSFQLEEFGIVMVTETIYVIGMSLMAFAVLPEMDAIQGAMLTNCLGLVPSVLGKKYFHNLNFYFLIKLQLFSQDQSTNRR